MKTNIEHYPCSVIVTDAEPVDTMNAPAEPQTFRFPFGKGEDYATREEAARAAEWFTKFVAPLM